MMNLQKTSKAGILKYLLIGPLALTLVISSNATTLISTAKNAILSETGTATEAKVSNQTALNNQEIVGNTDNGSEVTKILPPPPPPVKKSNVDAIPPPPPIFKTNSGDNVLMMADKMPQFNEETDNIMNYLSKNIRYPVEAIENNVEGKVLVQFIVNVNGEIENPKVLRSATKIAIKGAEITVVGQRAKQKQGEEVTRTTKTIGETLENEALRVVKSMPNWIPGEHKGKKVAVYYTLPITFKLQ